MPKHCPLILIANMRKANSFYPREELDDLISEGVSHELWSLVGQCGIKWDDHERDWYEDNQGRYRALWLDVYFRPGTLEWLMNMEDVRREGRGHAAFPKGGRLHPLIRR